MAVKLYTPDANVIVHETKVDFRRRVVQRQVNLVQYDKSMPVIAVQLCSNGNEYVLPEMLALISVLANATTLMFITNA